MGEYIGISTNDKTDGSADQKLTLMLMRWVWEKKHLLGSRVDVQRTMSEVKDPELIFLLLVPNVINTRAADVVMNVFLPLQPC
jgi:hypothetical protein